MIEFINKKESRYDRYRRLSYTYLIFLKNSMISHKYFIEHNS